MVVRIFTSKLRVRCAYIIHQQAYVAVVLFKKSQAKSQSRGEDKEKSWHWQLGREEN